MQESPRRLLEQRLQLVQERIQRACNRSGRSPHDVTLVAVTKSVSPSMAALMHEAGVLDLGESRPQELCKKREHLPPRVRWHLIGHLQRNKIARTLPVHLIHSVDSWRLAQALEHEAVQRGLDVDILLEVNVSGESAKHGFPPTALDEMVDRLGQLSRVHVRGLMTMAPYGAEPRVCRGIFAALRQLKEQLSRQLPSRHPLTELSMGMSDDFESAIEEGATLIRLGTILFEGLEAST